MQVATFAGGNWSFAPAPEFLEREKNRTAAKVEAIAARNETAYFSNGSATPPLGDRVEKALPPKSGRRVPAQPMLTCHYSVHDGFLDESAILAHARELADLSGARAGN